MPEGARPSISGSLPPTRARGRGSRWVARLRNCRSRGSLDPRGDPRDEVEEHGAGSRKRGVVHPWVDESAVAPRAGIAAGDLGIETSTSQESQIAAISVPRVVAGLRIPLDAPLQGQGDADQAVVQVAAVSLAVGVEIGLVRGGVRRAVVGPVDEAVAVGVHDPLVRGAWRRGADRRRGARRLPVGARRGVGDEGRVEAGNARPLLVPVRRVGSGPAAVGGGGFTPLADSNAT